MAKDRNFEDLTAVVAALTNDLNSVKDHFFEEHTAAVAALTKDLNSVKDHFIQLDTKLKETGVELVRLRHSVGDAIANVSVVVGQEPAPERALPCSAPAHTQLDPDRTCDEGYRDAETAEPAPASCHKFRAEIKNCTMSEFYALSKVVLEH